MKRTVTTREYDDEGRLIREVVDTYDDTPQCTCWQGWTLTWCPQHGTRYPTYGTWTSGGSITVSGDYTINGTTN